MSFPSPLLTLSNLRIVHLANNSLTELPAEIALMESLEVLTLSNNEFTEFTRKTALRLPPALQQLDLSHNHISSLPRELIARPQLAVLHAEGNPLESPPLHVAQAGLEAMREYWSEADEGRRFLSLSLSQSLSFSHSFVSCRSVRIPISCLPLWSAARHVPPSFSRCSPFCLFLLWFAFYA